MSRVEARAERERWKQLWKAKIALPGFISASLGQFIDEAGEPSASENTIQMVRSKASDRMTIRYDLHTKGTVYGKVYFDKGVALRAYEWLRHLWENGFGARSVQVPEPIGLVAEDGLLLMRSAYGMTLSQVLKETTPLRAVYFMRAAAQWLAKLHATPVPGLELEPPCEAMELTKTTALLAKVAAAHPGKAALLIELAHDWKTVAPSTNLPPKLVPVHGQFRPDHVFVEGSNVAAIDLDDLKLSDPAKDVARFIHALLKNCIETQRSLSRTALLADEFVATYNAFAPGNLTNLRYYVALYSLKELGKVIKTDKVVDEEKDLIQNLYVTSLRKCLGSNPTLCVAA